ncbi:DNA methyltransferase [Pseudobutyrivibrio ruminis]|uniref:DNA methyltransferase n=1 Tax=Pseudobutyrivibrio ruminis TaxID=46206 RepID=UPI00051B704F|nr:DNA methyltransferase [Pseudobutyrivibrio ruminis]
MSNKKITVKELPIDVIDDSIYVIDQQNPNSYTHNFFKYPCKFIPEIPRWAIKSYITNPDTSKILDPFAGSGTTLLESSLAGVPAMGTEIDEVAKLIIKVKTSKLSNEQIAIARSETTRIIDVLENHAYKQDEVVKPKINNLEHWFREDILNDLGYVCFSINKLNDENVRDFLLICMASIVKKVSNADDISPKPYVSNKIIKNPPEVNKMFSDTVDKYLECMEELGREILAPVEVSGSATNILADDNTFDLAITSPPYINAFDYVRTLRLENLWLNTASEDELREKKKKYFGTESFRVKEEIKNLDILSDSKLLAEYYEKIFPLDERRALVVKKFFEDMKTNLVEVYRTLKPGARYVIVIGNSTIRKVNIESWKVLKDIAIGVGYEYCTHISYEIQNHYIRIPRGNQGGKIAIDHILVLKK